MPRRKIALISTGGTIEKTYDELEGVMENQVSNLDVMLAQLILEGIEVSRVPLMNKDSLEMTPRDHDLIARTAHTMAEAYDGVVIVHGTDGLAITGERCCETHEPLGAPIVLTGAMRPYALKHTDALQNRSRRCSPPSCASPACTWRCTTACCASPGW
jgi:L-asparaginase